MNVLIDLAGEQRKNWTRKLRLTLWLLSVWMTLNVGVIWFAEELNELTFIGPAGFYMAAQGAPICYLLLIWWYAYRMDRIDGVAEVETGRSDVLG